MDMFKIKGGKKLAGSVEISGNKNSALPIIISTLLFPSKSKLINVPALADTQLLCQLLETFGVKIAHSPDKEISIDASRIDKARADYEMVRKMRASVLVLAPLLSRCGHAEVSLPGGCAIGSRPVDLHLQGLSELGANIKVEGGYIEASLKGSSFKGGRVKFSLPSVGATEQIILAAACAHGDTVIEGAAKEPEVMELITMLNNHGAKITGAGTSTIEISGVTSLSPSLEHEIGPDRIEAGTFIALAAATRSKITINKVRVATLENIMDPFSKAGCQFEVEDNGHLQNLTIKPPEVLKSVDIETAAYPGFPTDMQAQFMAAMTTAEGCSLISERIFENRMMHVPELLRLGAKIEINRGVAKVIGQKKLNGAKVMATDLRASASLVIATLVAEGESEIRRIYHLDRGYEELEKKLNSLSANVIRCKQD